MMALLSDVRWVPEALNVAAVTKLMRNLCLAGAIPFVVWNYARGASAATTEKRPAWHTVFPLFVVGFLAMTIFAHLDGCASHLVHLEPRFCQDSEPALSRRFHRLPLWERSVGLAPYVQRHPGNIGRAERLQHEPADPRVHLRAKRLQPLWGWSAGALQPERAQTVLIRLLLTMTWDIAFVAERVLRDCLVGAIPNVVIIDPAGHVSFQQQELGSLHTR